MAKQIISEEFKRMQKLAGLITESESKQLTEEDKQSFIKFVNLVADNIFTAGVNDPTMEQVNSWDTLFEYWEDFGNLSLHTQSDIIELANEAGVSESDLNYILDLPQVSSLERGQYL